MSDRLEQYFASEASEYLGRIEALLSTSGTPDLEQLLRLSKGVRGSAQMAGADSVAALAERLEEGVRSVQGSHVAWSEEIRRLSVQTVADLKLLVRASSRWGELEDERVRAAIARWDHLDPHAAVAGGGEAHRGPGATTVGGQGDGGPSPSRVVDIESLFYDDAGPHVLTSATEDEMNQPSPAAATQPVPIESLLLDRDGALREALALRREVERALREVPGAEVELAPAVDELFELIEIAAGGVAAEG